MIQNCSIAKLLKREIYSQFLTPSYYIASAFFLFSGALYFFYANRFFVLDMGSSDLRFFFEFMSLSAILVIPSITMGLWSKEQIESLLPVSAFYLVVSKWLSSLLISMFYVLASLPLIVLVSAFGTVDIALVLSSTFGIFLFLSTTCAFGQLCSIIFKHQATTFFVTALFLLLFTINGSIANGAYFQNVFLSNIAKFFSFSWNFDPFSKGIIDTRSLLFFILTTVLFIMSSTVYIEWKKYSVNSKTKTKKTLAQLYFSSLVLLCLLLWNAQIFYTRLDVTNSKRFSLSEYSMNLLNDLDSPLSISYFISSELESINPQIRDIIDYLYEYSTASNGVTVQIVEPHSSEIQSSLTSLGVSKQNIPRIEENRTSIVQAYSAIVLEYKNTIEVIPFVLDTLNLEFDIASRLQSLQQSLSRSAFVVVANDLSLEHDYPLVLPVLEASGFIVRELKVESLLQSANFDIRSPLVVLGSSQLDFEHVLALKTFIDIGGKVFFSVSPISINLDTWTSEYDSTMIHALFEMLKGYGIEIENALLHDSEHLQTQLLSNTGETLQVFYPFFIDIATAQQNSNTLLGKSFKGLSLLWPSPMHLDESAFNSQIAYTSSNSWIQKPNDFLINQGLNPFITNPFFDENLNANGVEQMSYNVASAAGDSIVVVSDQYFLSRGLNYIEQTKVFRNFDFLINSLLWLQGNYELIKLKSKAHIDYSLHKISENDRFNTTRNYGLIFLFVWYAIITACPMLYIKLKRKQNTVLFMKRSNEK